MNAQQMRGLVVALAVTLTCSTPAIGQTISVEGVPGPILVTDQEIKELEDEIMAGVAENLTRTCPRPTLDGEALPGDGQAELRRAFEGTDELKACRTLVVDGKLDLSPFIKGEKDLEPQVLAQLKSECAALPGLVRAATAHDQVCSPYLLGRNPLPEVLGGFRMLKVAPALARIRFDEGDSAAAVRELLDHLRFLQDLGRGGGPLMMEMAAVGITVDHDLALLSRIITSGKLDAPLLKEIAAKIKILQNTVPDLAGSLQDDGRRMALQYSLALLKEEGWTPPGGWDHGNKKPEQQDQGSLPLLHKNQEKALLFYAFGQLDRILTQRCDPNLSLNLYMNCYMKVSEELASRIKADSIPIKIWKVALAPEPGKALREQLLNLFYSMGLPNFRYIFVHHYRLLLALAGARVQAEAQLGGCPDTGELYRWRDLLQDPIFMDPMVVEAVEGGLVLKPGGKFLEGTGDEYLENQLKWSVTCPAQPTAP